MSDLESAQESFKQKIGGLLLSVQTMKAIDSQVLQEVDIAARLLASLLKDQESISKSLLNELHMAAKILRAEAPYVKEQSGTLIKIAEQLELTFDLILRGECHGDRVPGVPRVI